MKVAALDVGKTRIGMAVKTPELSSIQPIGTIERRTLSEDIERIGNELRVRGIERIIVGLPRNMNGSEGEAARKMRRFATDLRNFIGLPVELCDERLTTFEARERMRGIPVARGRRRSALDSVAAMIILENWLDSIDRR
jgi:putative Holliday junction resolvase